MNGIKAPLAGGHPISEAVADQAAQWLTLLMAGAPSDDDRLRWQQWRADHPDNERAWQHIEAVCGRFKGLHGGAAYQALSPMAAASTSRRKNLAILLGIGMAGAAGALASGSQPWRQLTADMRTGVGERRTWTLADGTRLLLNTNSAVKLDFDTAQRRLQLVAGEIMLVTGHAEAGRHRPFIVQTAQGSVRALGTVFTLRQQDGRTEVAVQESAVAITACHASGASLLVAAGQRTWFSSQRIAAPVPASADMLAWTQGSIVADDMRLADFLVELGRYRHGVLRCDREVADLRFSGVFPLRDVDLIVSMLPNSLPVRLRARGRYWITVEADPEQGAKK